MYRNLAAKHVSCVFSSSRVLIADLPLHAIQASLGLAPTGTHPVVLIWEMAPHLSLRDPKDSPRSVGTLSAHPGP